MRKLLITSFGLACAAVLGVGGVLAWTGSTTGAFAASSGTISVVLSGSQSVANELYPTGQPIAVETGGIQNTTPADPGINVHIVSGSVSGIATSSPPSPCDTFIGAGGVTGDVAGIDGTPVSPGGGKGGGWTARLTMAANAPDDCKSRAINYTVTINVAT